MPCAVHAATLDVSSLAPSSTMMSCTVHSPTDSLAQPSCIAVYIVCNPAPRGSPFELQSCCSLSSSWILLPSGARMSVRCSRWILNISSDICSMNLPMSLWRNTLSSLTLPSWECICYLSPHGQMVDIPPFLL